MSELSEVQQQRQKKSFRKETKIDRYLYRKASVKETALPRSEILLLFVCFFETTRTTDIRIQDYQYIAPFSFIWDGGEKRWIPCCQSSSFSCASILFFCSDSEAISPPLSSSPALSDVVLSNILKWSSTISKSYWCTKAFNSATREKQFSKKRTPRDISYHIYMYIYWKE